MNSAFEPRQLSDSAGEGSARAWSGFWRAERVAACVPDDPAAAALLEQHWSTWFASLPVGTRVLDIGTGNGALMICAARVAPGALVLTGIDPADIDPPRYLPEHRALLRAVHFCGGVYAESLPFPEHCFDVVVSQYGLEYAALWPALSEVARVLAPGGTLHCLMHDTDSAVVAEGRRQLTEIDLLLAIDGPFARMTAYVEAHRKASGVAEATAALTRALQTAQAYCEAQPPAALLRQLCGAILDTANQLSRYALDEVLQWLRENHRRLQLQRQRLLDQQAAALDKTRLARLRSHCGRAPWKQLQISSLGVAPSGPALGTIIVARTEWAGFPPSMQALCPSVA